MFHRLKMPPLTEGYLTNLVLLQIEMLEFASTKITKFDNGEDARKSNAQEYANYLKRDGSLFTENAQQIAEWIFDKDASTRNRLLPDFARAFQSEYNPGAKNDMPLVWRQQWLQRIKNEIITFLRPEKEILEIKYFYGAGDSRPKPGSKKEYPEWQQKTGDFFLFFYKTFLEGDGKLPPRLSSDKDAEAFGRQQFLKAFRDENSELEICPACDEARYYTQSGDKIYTTIDHFFPKEFYPHLACHPYNLIPTCHGCNSSIKGSTNPLASDAHGPGRIAVAALPYSEVDISNSTYLEVDLGIGTIPISINALRPRKPSEEVTESNLDKAIRMLGEVYKIPDRWSKKEGKQPADDLSTSDRISETLFRRMRQFLGDDPAIQRTVGTLRNSGILQSSSTALEVYNTLKFLLYYLDKEDKQKDPFAFALTWMLATLIEEDIRPLLSLAEVTMDQQAEQTPSRKNGRGRALLEEVNSWFGPDFDKQQERDQHTNKLLSILQRAEAGRSQSSIAMPGNSDDPVGEVFNVEP